jgi:type II secretory pathway pseudopilin PulG
MTLVELSFTIGIMSLLLAMVLGLARHVNAITKVRRAQTELGQWHEALDRWFIQFGEYPCYDARKGDQSDSTLTCWPKGNYNLNLTHTVSNACVRVGDNDYVYFSSYVAGAPSLLDPWGKPYIYIAQDDNPDDGISGTRIVCHLFSCGPNGKSSIINPNDTNTERDDIYFE